MADQALVELHSAYTSEVAALRGATEDLALDMWTGLPDYRDTSIDQLARRASSLVSAAQQEIGTLTDVYLSEYQAIATGRPVVPAGVPPQLLDDLALRGVPALDVYLRTGPTVWTALSKGTPLTDAVALGQRRLTSMLQIDLQLAKTHASRHSGQRRGVKYFRRELEGSKSCGLCIVASTQRYTVGDLMPIHGNCDCSVAEIYADVDPGQILEPERLDRVHEAINAEFGGIDGGARVIPGNRNVTRNDIAKYSDVLVTNTHGEIGPVLGVKGHEFIGPSDF